jgi:hypothetical protein
MRKIFDVIEWYRYTTQNFWLYSNGHWLLTEKMFTENNSYLFIKTTASVCRMENANKKMYFKHIDAVLDSTMS